jgi:hypothetical protein
MELMFALVENIPPGNTQETAVQLPVVVYILHMNTPEMELMFALVENIPLMNILETVVM